MQKKLPLKDVLAAIDLNAKNVWDELSDEERKQVSFYLLNRYVSSVKGQRDKAELAVFKTNEYYNKGFFLLQKHKKLLWQLLCMSGNTGKIQYHEWIGYKFKTSPGTAKAIKFLEKLYPTKKADEINLLAKINSAKDIKQLAEDYGMTKEQINTQL